MVKCSFCGRDEKSYKGLHLIRNIGVVNYFCSSKCRRNMIKLGRDKRKFKWTEAFHQTRGKARDKVISDAAIAAEKAANPIVEVSKKKATKKVVAK